MRFSVAWLKKWVDIDVDVHELAERLTGSGLEVDAVVSVRIRGCSGETLHVVESAAPE